MPRPETVIPAPIKTKVQRERYSVNNNACDSTQAKIFANAQKSKKHCEKLLEVNERPYIKPFASSICFMTGKANNRQEWRGVNSYRTRPATKNEAQRSITAK
jgi:hypothetical protein